ncbi:hypothetical protein POM88_015741 [Heracleum sosnowskyi]|uniref:Uncharacterized protein n=1 Tax=Heracleum sosnowskyi TaxID=360622 RepID=A0AAD8ILY8_9APIA|nr:hypothetical protein POM88_015741 [Heracleum sosnowskyi]
MTAPSVVEAQPINNIINITGTVSGTAPCSFNATFLTNGTFTGNPFRNTAVQLRCGITHTLVASTTTDTNGNFGITIDPPTGGFVTALVIAIRTSRNCTAVVPTPLFTCNSTQPSNGTLVSALTRGPTQRVGRTRTLPLLALAFTFNN